MNHGVVYCSFLEQQQKNWICFTAKYDGKNSPHLNQWLLKSMPIRIVD